jgi:hypothetical protein
MKNRFKLYLSWESIEYKSSTKIALTGARLFGPVLKEVARINSNDSIHLDLTSQFIITSGAWEIAIFSWGEVLKQSNEYIELSGASIESEQLVNFKKLSNTNMLLIDTEAHQEEKHMYNFVYNTKIIDRGTINGY